MSAMPAQVWNDHVELRCELGNVALENSPGTCEAVQLAEGQYKV
jgi:hypothetical protein